MFASLLAGVATLLFWDVVVIVTIVYWEGVAMLLYWDVVVTVAIVYWQGVDAHVCLLVFSKKVVFPCQFGAFGRVTIVCPVRDSYECHLRVLEVR